MTHQERWDRALAIAARIRQLVAELDRLPKVPITAFLDAEMRRKYRRFAARLRAGKVEPRYRNLFTAEQLAEICEQACARDEFLEKMIRELHELGEDLRTLLAENDAELARQATPELLQMKDAAAWLGADSVAAQHYRDIQQVRRQGQRRRNRPFNPQPEPIPLPGTDYELHLRHWLAAAEILPEGTDEGHVGLRIGIGEQSWVGSFQRGHTDYTTVQLMPDNRHLLVVTDGAGYVVELVTNTHVASLGRDIGAVVCDQASPLLLIDHGGKSLEAYGPEGRMWSTGAIASGGFRDFGVTGGVLAFDACQANGEWVEVGLDPATGALAPV